ncbi:hypothetical protein EK904_004735 [Melospiza melodia maxima]|nr:hypothetical protein EK904_004735 [Melospiza melodia maxima]
MILNFVFKKPFLSFQVNFLEISRGVGSTHCTAQLGSPEIRASHQSHQYYPSQESGVGHLAQPAHPALPLGDFTKKKPSSSLESLPPASLQCTVQSRRGLMLRAAPLTVLPCPGGRGGRRCAGHSPVEGTVLLQEVRAALRRDTDGCLGMRNLRKFSTFEARFPGLNEPRCHCQPACWPAREPHAAEAGGRARVGQQHPLEAGVIQIIKWKKKCSVIVLGAPSTCVSDTVFYVTFDS